MSPFEVVYGYKPKKPIDFIYMMHHRRVSKSASAFASHVHDLHKETVRKFKKIMHTINFMLICTAGILNLMRVIT